MATKTTRRPAAITATARELLDALGLVARAVPARGPKPILANVRIGDGLMVSTDLEIQVATQLPMHCDPFLVPAARLHAILRSVPPDSEVAMTPDASRVKIAAASGRWEIPTEDVAEFPAWEPADAKPIARLPADQFVRAVRSTVYAADNESSRFALGAVLVDVTGGDPTFVATDGRRLSAVEAETDQAVDDSQTLIPSRAIRLMAVAASGQDSVQLEATKAEVVCTTGGTTVTARLSDGRYPRWRDVFPSVEVQPHRVLVADLLAATMAASICTSEQSLGVLFEFGERLALTSQSAEAGTARVKCDLAEAGQPGKTKLDPRFVREFLSALDADDEPEVEVSFSDAQSAVVLRCGDVRGVIMPLAEDA